MEIETKRIYEGPSSSDGYRVLVDRLWPRGISKDSAKLDLWLKEVAPSDGLRKWFRHEAPKFEDFRQRYIEELAEAEPFLEELRERAAQGRLTLLYSAKDQTHNHAVVLAEVLESGTDKGNPGS